MLQRQAVTMKSALGVTDPTDLREPRTDIQRGRSAAETDRGDQTASAGPESAANWLWVAPDVGRALALVVGEISPVYRRGLATRFARVEQIPVAALHTAASPEHDGRRAALLPYDDSSVDCVISTDLVNRWFDSPQPPYRDPRFVAALAELRRVLRSNGVLFLGGRNAQWYRAWLPLGGEDGPALRYAPRVPFVRPFLQVESARGAMAGAGFSDTRAYFVEPSIADPLTVVPASRHAAMAYERSRWPRGNMLLRSLSAAGGMYRLLYPDAFVLGIK
jgi:SAM-dependent methyltransferase